MRTFILIIIVFVSHTCSSQNINWSKCREWTLYDIRDGNAFTYALDTLHNFKQIALNDSIMASYLQRAEVWSKDSSSLWMGLYVTTCKTEDGQIRIIDISVYGGFLYDVDTKRYYSIYPDLRVDWLNYLLEEMIKLSSSSKN
jgi:hypothetical protein